MDNGCEFFVGVLLDIWCYIRYVGFCLSIFVWVVEIVLFLFMYLVCFEFIDVLFCGFWCVLLRLWIDLLCIDMRRYIWYDYFI